MRIIGMGSGRCGTQTLARLLDGCDFYKCVHEPNPKLPWNVNKSQFRPHNNHEHSSVALYYGKYWRYFDNVRFIVLKRDKEETVQSFLDITPDRDHWSSPQNELWDMCFPTYDDLDKRESIERYYDEYYEMMPKDALWIETQHLSVRAAQEDIFDWAEIPKNDRKYQKIVANKREDHYGYRTKNISSDTKHTT